jgi:hypothetical protein
MRKIYANDKKRAKTAIQQKEKKNQKIKNINESKDNITRKDKLISPYVSNLKFAKERNRF